MLLERALGESVNSFGRWDGISVVVLLGGLQR